MKDRLQFALILLSLPTLLGAVSLSAGDGIGEALKVFAIVSVGWGGPMLIGMFILSRLTDRKIRTVGGWIEAERHLKSTFAVMYLRGDSASGVLALTDLRLRFCGHRFNAIPEVDYSFALQSVEWVGLRRLGRVVPNCIGVRLCDGREIRFLVFRRRLWRDVIASRSACLPRRS